MCQSRQSKIDYSICVADFFLGGEEGEKRSGVESAGGGGKRFLGNFRRSFTSFFFSRSGALR